MKLISKASTIKAAKESTIVVAVSCAKSKLASTCPSSGINATLKQLEKDGAFKAKEGSVCFVRNPGLQNTLYVGLGEVQKLTLEKYRIAGANLYKKLKAEKISDAALCFASFSAKVKIKGATEEHMAQALAEGILLSDYSFDNYKTDAPKAQSLNVTIYADKKQKTVSSALNTAEAEAETVTIARDLSNEPGNVLVPMELAKRAKAYAKKYGLKCKVLEKAELKKEKCGGILGVGQGSANPPCMIVLEYKPKKAKKGAKHIALVGKAITFDTGGISLKPGGSMDEMKHDMSGGANMIAAICLAAKLKCPNPVTAVIAAAENMPDGNAIVPSTILHSRSGKTIEVLNTDAEGRLVLCDALDYAQDKKPDVVFDMATLTGAVVVALGSGATGIMGNDPGTISKIKDAAVKTGENHWELPIYDIYREDMKGKVGDLRNIGGDRGAGSSKAGAFLEFFIRPKQKWAHFDVAATAWNMRHLPYCPSHGATGHGVRTLVQFAMDYK